MSLGKGRTHAASRSAEQALAADSVEARGTSKLKCCLREIARSMKRSVRPHTWTTLTANDGSAQPYSLACFTSPLVSHPPHLPGRLRPIRCNSFGGCPLLSSVVRCSRPTWPMSFFDFVTQRGQRHGTLPWPSLSALSRLHSWPTFMTWAQPRVIDPECSSPS